MPLCPIVKACRLSLFFLLAACGGREGRHSSPLFTEKAETASAPQHYDLHEIQSSGTLLGGTLSGPDTYYEYHGREFGLQFRLAEEFAQSIGVRLQMETAPDTATLLRRLERGEIDVVFLSMPRPRVRGDAPMLAQRLDEWWDPKREQRLRAAEASPTVTVRRRMRPAMLDAAHGRLSAWDNLFRRHSGTVGWDWRLLAAQCYQESGFDPNAISSMGAQGLMQLMPATAEMMGLQSHVRFDPDQNVAAAVRYLRQLDASFSDIRDGEERIRFMLASYNGGAGHIRDAQRLARKEGRRADSWREVVPYVLLLSQPRYYRDPDVQNGYMRGAETVSYVRLIMERWRQYRAYARPYGSGATPAPARRSLQDGVYKSLVKSADELRGDTSSHASEDAK